MIVLGQIYLMVLLFGGIIGALVSVICFAAMWMECGLDSEETKLVLANTGVGIVLLTLWPVLVALALPALLVYSLTMAFKVYVKKEEIA